MWLCYACLWVPLCLAQVYSFLQRPGADVTVLCVFQGLQAAAEARPRPLQSWRCVRGLLGAPATLRSGQGVRRYPGGWVSSHYTILTLSLVSRFTALGLEAGVRFCSEVEISLLYATALGLIHISRSVDAGGYLSGSNGAEASSRPFASI
jgi:hypothetical protein